MLAGFEGVPTTALLGQPFELGVPVAIGTGVVPVEVELDPEFVPQAVSMNANAVVSKIINQSDFRLSI